MVLEAELKSRIINLWAGEGMHFDCLGEMIFEQNHVGFGGALRVRGCAVTG